MKASPSLGRVLRVPFPCVSGTMGGSDFLTPLAPHFVAFAWRYHGRARRFAPRRPDAPAGTWGSLAGSPLPRSVAVETAGSLRFLGNPGVPMPCSGTPAGPLAPGLTVQRRGPRNGENEGSHDLALSGLDYTAWALAVVRFAEGVASPRRPTRFRLLARLVRTALVTRRVSSKGFRNASLPLFLLSQAFLTQRQSATRPRRTDDGGRWTPGQEAKRPTGPHDSAHGY